MRPALLALGFAIAMAGCAGREEMRSTASQSGAILNQAQRDAADYATAQTELDETIVANIASFNAMAAEGAQAMKADQTVWVDQTMKGYFDSLKPADPGSYLKALDEAAAPPEQAKPTVVDTSKVRLAVSNLNELAKEQDLESQLSFLVQFALGVEDAFKQAQKKAAEVAGQAQADANPLVAAPK
jgi:hypothetical protein